MNHAPPVPSPEIAARQRRITLTWRIAFVAYIVALTLGTHWPRLELPRTVPATDKTIHLLAFAGLTILLWQTRWITRLWLAALIVLCWSIIDELTQGLPGLNRTVTRHDFIANALGVMVAAAWIWALRTRGVVGGMNRVRMARFNYVVEEMFADWRAWRAGAVGAIVAGVPLALYWIMQRPGDEVIRKAIVIAAAACVVITYLGLMRIWRIKHEQAMRRRPCIHCGADTSQRAEGGSGDDVCRRCGSSQSSAMWMATGAPSGSMMLRMAIKPALIGLAALLVGFALILLSPLLHAYFLHQGGTGTRLAPRLANSLGTLPQELVNAIDLAAYLLLFAVVARLYRGALARFYDRTSICLRCGHDLRATPVDERGAGRCGECGAAFARIVKT